MERPSGSCAALKGREGTVDAGANHLSIYKSTGSIRLSITGSSAGTAVTSLLAPPSSKRGPRADFGLFLKSQGSEEVERPLEIKLQRLNAKKGCHSGPVKGSSSLT
jgi:hypothetical protein